MNKQLSLSTGVVLSARRHGLRAGQDNSVDVLVRIQAPDAPAGHAARRPPQAVALVIDRSGSMSGRPLAEARRCAEFVLSQLRPDDAVSLVQFDDGVQRLWPATPLGDGAAQRAAMAGLEAGGSTDLHAGWQEGADTLAALPGISLRRVIVLSDGQANAGLTDAAAIAAGCVVRAAQGITTSTYGLGRDFNEALMMDMARAGGGNAYYGDSAEDLMEPFQQELALLGNLCLRDLRLVATVPPGCEVELLNPYAASENGWRLPDLAWGAEAWALLRIKLPSGALPATGASCTVLRVTVTGASLEGEPVALERTGLSLPLLSQAAFDDLADDELVTRRLVELAAAAALMEMRAAAQAGDWGLVDRLLEAASRQFAGNAWVAAMLAAMRSIAASRERERALKELMYSSDKLRRRLVEKNESMGLYVGDASAVPAYLRRKPSQGKGAL